MRSLVAAVLLSISVYAQQLPHDDAVRIAEFYKLSSQTEDGIWPGWSKVPIPLLLVTDQAEFLTHHPSPPKDFKKIADDLYTRPRQFSTALLATFPAFGPPSVIVIGEPKNTEAKTSTPWVITLMHEHFHQLQSAQPGYYDAVAKLGLSKNDETGMWMLNYPFPYENPETVRDFAGLRDELLRALGASDHDFEDAAAVYIAERKRIFGKLSPDDRKYLSFQLWQEGIARYTQVKAAEAAAQYEPAQDYEALADYESFSSYAKRARNETLAEFRQADLSKMKRTYVYSFGAAEGFLLDRINPKWKDEYFKYPLSTDRLFEPQTLGR